MDGNGVHFQLDYNQLELLLSQGDLDTILYMQNNKIGNTFPSTHFQTDDINNNVFVPTFFHPSQDEELHPGSNDDVIAEHGASGESSPLSSLKSVTELIIQSSADKLTAVFDTTTPAMNTTAHTTTFHQHNLFNKTSSSSSSSLNSTSEWASEEIGAVFIVCLMIPFIICSNLLVIFSVFRFRRLHTPTNYFITSLAAVDIIVGLVTPLVIAVQIFQYGGNDDMSGAIVCLLPNRILMMSCGVSLLNLATIAYDRHTALICPLEYVNIMTSRKVAILMISTWFYSAFIVWLPLMLGWYDSSFPSSQCSVDHLHQKAHILFIAAIFVPSCTVILICYSRIFLIARHHAKSIAAVEFAVHRRLQVRFMIKDTKYAKTLALVIGGFLALWLPYLIYTFMKTICGFSLNVWLETYLILLAVFNSGINPWIYAFKNNEFQAAFKRMARDYCSNLVCRGDERRGSLMSGVSTTPRLSRTDSRIVSTLLVASTDYGVSDKGNQGLGYLNSLDSDPSNYKTHSCHINMPNDAGDKRSKYSYRDSSLPDIIDYENETDNVAPFTEMSMKEGNSIIISSKDIQPGEYQHSKDIQPGEYQQVCNCNCKDELFNPVHSSVLNFHKPDKQHVSQFKKIKKKGSQIIRSSSALPSIRPYVTLQSRPSSSLPSSPIQIHTSLVTCPMSPEKPRKPNLPRFHSIRLQPPFFPSPRLSYPKFKSHHSLTQMGTTPPCRSPSYSSFSTTPVSCDRYNWPTHHDSGQIFHYNDHDEFSDSKDMTS